MSTHRNNWRILFASGVILFFSSWLSAQSTQTLPSDERKPDSTGVIWFFRTKSITDSVLNPTIYSQGKALAKLEKGEFFRVSAEPGIHYFSWSPHPSRREQAWVNLLAGQEIYFQVKYRSIRPVDSRAGLEEIHGLLPVSAKNVIDSAVYGAIAETTTAVLKTEQDPLVATRADRAYSQSQTMSVQARTATKKVQHSVTYITDPPGAIISPLDGATFDKPGTVAQTPYRVRWHFMLPKGIECLTAPHAILTWSDGFQVTLDPQEICRDSVVTWTRTDSAAASLRAKYIQQRTQTVEPWLQFLQNWATGFNIAQQNTMQQLLQQQQQQQPQRQIIQLPGMPLLNCTTRMIGS
jgi:hypothetical protein